jgi:sarcosine oxidase
MNITVVGAGAFGGWTALELQKRGADVTLIDAWGPGNSRSSSGGETRAIRALYGVDELYVEMVARARVLWQRAEREWNEQLMERTGSFWMFRGDESYANSCLPHLKKHGFRIEQFGSEEGKKRYPQINFTDIESCLFEPDAGMLFARRATQVVRDQFVAAGGSYQVGAVNIGTDGIVRSGDRTLSAEQFVFACGAWLPEVFPDLLGGKIAPTREEVMYFGVPAGSDAFNSKKLPVWIDMGPPILYGFPGGDDRGFKLSDDTRGPPIDPTDDVRVVNPDTIARGREYLAYRFPALADAPLLETRVCQYENSPDGHYIIDRHPAFPNVWVCGGGSGHGFKMGPAIGELMARLVLDGAAPVESFRLDRLDRLDRLVAPQRRITQFDRR